MRVSIQQPALPKYRVPLFIALSDTPGMDVHVYYGRIADLPNADAGPCKATYRPQRFFSICGVVLAWHSVQLQIVSKRLSDVVVLSWNTRYLSLLPALVKAKVLGIPVILHGHGFSKSESTLRRIIRDAIARMARAVVVYNYTIAAALLGRGFAKDRVFVSLNTIDQREIQLSRSYWLSNPTQLEGHRIANGLPQRNVILFVSRLQRANRLDVAIEAVSLLRARIPDVVMVIIGDGEPERAKLVSLAAKLDVIESVRFVSAQYDEALLAPWFIHSSIFCYPSNMGLSVAHAFGYGLPVVAGDCLGEHNPEIELLQDDVNGLLFRHGDSQSLAAVLGRILGDPGLQMRLSKAALSTVLDYATLERATRGFREAIAECAGEKA